MTLEKLLEKNASGWMCEVFKDGKRVDIFTNSSVKAQQYGKCEIVKFSALDANIISIVINIE